MFYEKIVLWGLGSTGAPAALVTNSAFDCYFKTILKNGSDLIGDISKTKKELWILYVLIKPMIEMLFPALRLFVSLAQKQ